MSEEANKFQYNGYLVKILVKDANDENTSFGFEIYEYNEINIPCDDPIYKSFDEYECENEDQAEQDAKDWIDEYEDLSRIGD